MAIFQGGNVQIVKPGDKICFDKMETEGKMKTVYILFHNWWDLENHDTVLGVFETEELAEEHAVTFRNSNHTVDEYDEIKIQKVLLNHFVWEQEASND